MRNLQGLFKIASCASGQVGRLKGSEESRSNARGPKGPPLKETSMSKLIHLSAICVSLALATSAFAADDAMMSDEMGSDAIMECTDASMSKMKTDVMGMPAGEMKDMAMKEMQMAEDMGMKKDMKGCAEHMGKAMEAMH